MRTRNYSVLSVAQAATDTDAGAELEFLQELEDAIEAMGSSRFTLDGRPAMVAAETRARLGEAIKELTQAQISNIADGAEKFGKKDQRVLLEVVQGDDEKPDAQLKFPETNVSAQYIYYNEEAKEDARLLQELKRIQYLQNVVMKQLEMTDRSGSTQVVQGMIASGQKFVAGLTAVFKQVEALSKQIEKGLQNKADMPTAEQKATAVASITQALRELPAIDPRHIAVKNMVMKQVERMQAKFTMTPTAPRASATVLHMKALQTNAAADAKTQPVAKTDAKVAVKGDVKADTKIDAKADVKASAKAAPVAKTEAKATADVKAVPTAKGQPAAPVAKTDAKVIPVAQATPDVKATAPVAKVDAKAAPVVAQAKVDAGAKADVKGTAPVTAPQAKIGVTTPSETMRQMTATVTAIAPNVSAQQTIARVGNASPVAALQATLAKALGITPASIAPVSATAASATPLSVAKGPASVASAAPATGAAPASVTGGVSSVTASVASSVASGTATQTAAAQTNVAQTAPAQIMGVEARQGVEPTMQQQIQQHVQQGQLQTSQPLQQVQPAQQFMQQQTGPQHIGSQQTVQQVAQSTPNTGAADNVVQLRSAQPVGAPIAIQANVAEQAGTQGSGTQGGGTHVSAPLPTVIASQGQPIAAGQTMLADKGQQVVADAGVKGIEARYVPSTVETGKPAAADAGVAKGKITEARQTVDVPETDKSKPTEVKKGDAKVTEDKLPERPIDRTELKTGDKEADKKKDAKVDEGPCGGCGNKGACGTCRVASLQGKGSSEAKYGTDQKGEADAKAKVAESLDKCSKCGGNGGCPSCVKADPAVTMDATKTAQQNRAPRRAAPTAPAPGRAA